MFCLLLLLITTISEPRRGQSAIQLTLPSCRVVDRLTSKMLPKPVTKLHAKLPPMPHLKPHPSLLLSLRLELLQKPPLELLAISFGCLPMRNSSLDS